MKKAWAGVGAAAVACVLIGWLTLTWSEAESAMPVVKHTGNTGTAAKYRAVAATRKTIHKAEAQPSTPTPAPQLPQTPRLQLSGDFVCGGVFTLPQMPQLQVENANASSQYQSAEPMNNPPAEQEPAATILAQLPAEKPDAADGGQADATPNPSSNPASPQDHDNNTGGAPEDDPYADPFAGAAVATKSIPTLADPAEGWNRRVFGFNDFVYFQFLKPVSTGYKSVVPKFARRAIRNFFANLQEPVYFLNSVLQNKPGDAQIAMRRFLVNSTVGVGGLGTPIKDRPDSSKRTFDQTFAKWGISPGAYVVWPFVGSSSFLRATAAWAGDEAMNPFNYGDAGTAAGASVGKTVNETSFQLGTYEDFKKYAVDPYASLKDIYEKRIHKKEME